MGDPTWRPIEADAKAKDLGVAHPHINDEGRPADPVIALPMHLLSELASEGVLGRRPAHHASRPTDDARSREQ
jgi:hypothetical protein